MKNFKLVKESAIVFEDRKLYHIRDLDELLKHEHRCGARTLYRIRALVDYPNGHAKKGDIGGYIESEDNLSDWAWVADDAKVFDSAQVYDNAYVYHHATVSDSARVFGNAEVFGNAHVFNKAKVFNTAKVCGYARVYGFATVFENASVLEDTFVADYAKIFGNATISGDGFTRITGYSCISGDSKVTGGVSIAHANFQDASINSVNDYMVILGVGSTGNPLTIYKSKNGVKVSYLDFDGTQDVFSKMFMKAPKHFHVECQQLIEIAKARILSNNQPK